MSRKIKVLRILVAVLLLVVFIGYFTFTTLLFPPFESGLGVDVSGLVPRQVDFFFARSDLNGSFDEFPRLLVADDIEKQPGWKVWTESPECERLKEEYGYGGLMASVQEQLAQLPAGLEPLDVFGGDDMALAGNFKGSSFAEADWAAYGTLSNTGKFAISMLAFPSLIGLDEQGISVESEDGVFTLSGGSLTTPISVGRVRDVGVVSNTKELVAEAIKRDAEQFKNSFLAGGTYNDKIQLADRNAEQNELEIFVNTRDLMESLKISGSWPDPQSPDVLPKLASKFFQLGEVNRLVGILGLDEGLTLDLNLPLSGELLTPMQTRLSRLRTSSADELVDRYAVFAPADTGLFLFFKCDVGDLLTSVVESLEPATRSLIEERFQATGKYRDLQHLIDEIDSALLDHFIIIVRENDYRETADGPPHNDVPMPAVGLVTWLAENGRKKIDDLRYTIGGMGPSIGLQGAEPGQDGFWSMSVGGHEFNEYWSPYIDGTGVITAGTTSEVFVVSNTVKMFDHIHKTWTQGAPKYPRLSERSDFRALARSAEAGANLALWANPRELMGTLNRSVDQWAMDSIQVDWTYERARVEDKVLREQYPGKQKGTLSPLEKSDFERAVDQRIDEIDLEIRRTQVPLAREKYERTLAYLNSIQAGLLMLAIQDKPVELDLSLRLMTPFDD
ncbi:MAG: hypothetical protein ACI9F9_002068 [Candidatus Paceibacteria bacterium]|jgi:hypothetical protein